MKRARAKRKSLCDYQSLHIYLPLPLNRIVYDFMDEDVITFTKKANFFTSMETSQGLTNVDANYHRNSFIGIQGIII